MLLIVRFLEEKRMDKDFETALKELEEIVKKLENKDIKLNEMIENYNKGLELSKYCYNTLIEAEKLIVKTASDMENFNVE